MKIFCFVILSFILYSCRDSSENYMGKSGTYKFFDYYDHGELFTSAIIKNNKMCGLMTQYFSDGPVCSRSYFQDGILQTRDLDPQNTPHLELDRDSIFIGDTVKYRTINAHPDDEYHFYGYITMISTPDDRYIGAVIPEAGDSLYFYVRQKITLMNPDSSAASIRDTMIYRQLNVIPIYKHK